MSDLGAVSLKNIAEPVRAYALDVGTAARTAPVKIAAATPRRRWWFGVLSVVGIAAAAAVAILQPMDRYFLSRGESEFLAGRPKAAIESYNHARELNLKVQIFLIASYAAAGMGDGSIVVMLALNA